MSLSQCVRNLSYLYGVDVHVRNVKNLKPFQSQETVVGQALDGVGGDGESPQPWHDVPDHRGRGGQVVVGQVQAPHRAHVGQGGGRDEGQLVGGHVEADQRGQGEAGQDREGRVGQVQPLQTEL